MSVKRRDNKNRILRTGESQEADGRYKFRYVMPMESVNQCTAGDW